MPIEIVKSFRTSDGNLHQTREAATAHETLIELRGVIQSASRSGGNSNYSTTDVAKLLISNMDEIQEIFTSYRKSIGALNRKANEAIAPLQKAA